MKFVTQGEIMTTRKKKKSNTSNNEASKSGKTKLENPVLIMCALFNSRP
jgi:hypothetical protein